MFKLIVKYMITLRIPKLSLKKITFLSLHMKISGKNLSFDYKKIKKSYFYINKKVNKIDDIDININISS